MALAVDPFLTSYDPSDLPGGSIDPLGFDRAYNHLANCFLPGLTNVASVPRYFSVLCTGILLANVSAAATPREKLKIRLESVQRLERFWGVANVLASVDDSDMALGGLRGVRYARGRVGPPRQTIGLSPYPCSATMLPSAISTASAPTTHSFRGSITRPVRSLSTLRSRRRRRSTQDSLPAGGPPWPDGIRTRWVPS